MRYFKQLYNYFLSAHLTNPRFRNNINTLTRFFSESNTKLRTTITGLGNVFRNARWSDFKVQNVKTLLTNRYLLTLILFLTLTVLYNTWLPINYQWFLALIYFEISIDLVTELSLYLTTIYCTLLWRTNPTNSLTRVNTLKNTTTPVTNTLTSQPNIIQGLDQHTSYYSVLSDLHNLVVLQPRLVVTKLPYNNTFILPYKNPTLLNDNSYSISTLLGLGWSQNFDLTTSLNFLNTSTNSNITRNLLLQAATDTLDTNKQERWLVKNSPTSSRTRLWNKRSVYTKRFISSAVTNSKYSDRNLWASNFGATGTKSTTFLPNKLVNSVTLPDKVLLNSFNTFEESRNFFNKRFMFLVNSSLLIGSKVVIKPNFSTYQNHSSLVETFGNTVTKSVGYFNNDLLPIGPSLGPKLVYRPTTLVWAPLSVLVGNSTIESLVTFYYSSIRSQGNPLLPVTESYGGTLSDHVTTNPARAVMGNGANQAYNNILANQSRTTTQATFHSLIL